MVLRVCRDVLRDPHDGDDAFQATFLILSRRAAAIRRRESVGPWLYGVALRVARCALKQTARRRVRERNGAETSVEGQMTEVDRLDAAPLLHEEVGRLAESHRAPVVLCYFEGLTHEQAAAQLGWPVGTVRSRLARARDTLRSRLTRRGIAPSAGFLIASAAAEGTSAVVPSALVAATVRIAMRAAEAGAVPASVAALVGRVLRVMAMTKLSMVATGLVAAGLVASAGVGLVAGQQPGSARRQDTGKAASNPPGGDFFKASMPRPLVPANPGAVETKRDVAVPATPSGVLWTRLVTANSIMQMTRQLRDKGDVSNAEYWRSRGDVDTLAAELKARAEDLDDELELLQARLAIRQADVDGADAQVAKASDREKVQENLAKRNVISTSELSQIQQDHAIARAERAKKQAELKEVVVRIKQAKRRRDEAAELVKRADELLKKPGITPDPPAAPAR
jgi:RNA polymerase sigma factor (sigma-70 family)